MEATTLNIAVSSRALFDFEEENKVFQTQGDRAYRARQRELLNKPAKKGVSFALIKKLLSFNQYMQDEQPLVNISVVSRNDPTTGLRVFRAIKHFDLDIRQGCFTRGEPPYRYLTPLNAHLFLSAYADDVREALKQGVPAAHVLGGTAEHRTNTESQLRIAFDGDAVLFGDQSEKVYQEKGLDAFIAQEVKHVHQPLKAGPLKTFFEALCALKAQLPETAIRTALITARGSPAHERPLRTLMDWGLEIDEAFFLSGMDKKEIIEAFQPDFYFDDQIRHLQDINTITASAHVDYGIANQKPASSPPTIKAVKPTSKPAAARKRKISG